MLQSKPKVPATINALLDDNSGEESDESRIHIVDNSANYNNSNRNNSQAFLTPEMSNVPANVPEKDEDDERDSLFLAMRLPILIGAFWGLLPLTNPNASSVVSWHSWVQCRTLTSLLIILLITSNTLFMGIDFVDKLAKASSHPIGLIVDQVSKVWFSGAGLFVYSFCLIRSSKCIHFLFLWKRTLRKIKDTMRKSGNLKRELNCICAVVMMSAVGENILFHVYSMRTGIFAKGVDVTFLNFLEDFYKSNQYMHRFLGYNPVLAILLFAVNKLTLFAWNFGDVLLMMFSWALYTLFRDFNAFIEDFLCRELHVPYTKLGAIPWNQFRKNYSRAVRLVDEADRIFYPLLWVSYATNIFFVCNQLYIGIGKRDVETTVQRAYVIWSFLHLLLRTLAVNMFAARINESSQVLGRLLQFCPPQEYNPDVRRLERFISSRVIGITANGVFVVTRSFILMIMSAIFTLEVVLLQNSGISRGNSTGCSM